MKDLILNENLVIQPKVEFNAQNGNCLISGHCYPEDGFYFFKNLSEWLNEYIEDVEGPISFTINLKYFNTGSSRGIFLILNILKNYKDMGGNVQIIWHYDEIDEDMLEEINEHSNEAKISILKVPY